MGRWQGGVLTSSFGGGAAKYKTLELEICGVFGDRSPL